MFFSYLEQSTKTVAPITCQCGAFCFTDLASNVCLWHSWKQSEPWQMWMLPIHCALMEACRWWNIQSRCFSWLQIGTTHKSTNEKKNKKQLKSNISNALSALGTMVFSIYPVIPLASSLHLSRLPGIGFLLKSRNFVLRLQSTGTWQVGFSSSSISTEFVSNSSCWLRRFAKFGSLLFSGFFDVVGTSFTFASKLNTESSDTYSVVSGWLWRVLFLSGANLSLQTKNMIDINFWLQRNLIWYDLCTYSRNGFLRFSVGANLNLDGEFLVL